MDACGATFVEQGVTGLCSLQLQVQPSLHVRLIEVSRLLFSLPGISSGRSPAASLYENNPPRLRKHVSRTRLAHTHTHTLTHTSLAVADMSTRSLITDQGVFVAVNFVWSAPT